MNGIVKSRGRYLARRQGERFEDVVNRLAVTAGGAEYRRDGCRVAACVDARLLCDRERELDRNTGATSLRCRQQLTRRDRGRRTNVRLDACKQRTARAPVAKSWPCEADALEVNADQATNPSTRLQLLPPKPKELLRTRSRRPARVFVR